ncbi:hypothetical protein [Arthrobacter sp. M4]|uniref:hypothetical protein n=1 Tax=Arthrobacter sp. M4 TaxID=218160 RepID=UPI001CDCA2BB|nr:hypothetical protein [Arthrobacter sp. M4]MCA4134869.1 hypothetical protein [Arthrobacter sp. M4]
MFDVFFQTLGSGDSGSFGEEAMRKVLDPHVVLEDPGGFLQIQVGDGAADVYIRNDGMLANHVSGEDPWDLLVQGAAAGGWVIMPAKAV